MDRFFTAFASRISALSGTPHAFVVAFGVVLAWAVTGPLFAYSELWQCRVGTAGGWCKAA